MGRRRGKRSQREDFLLSNRRIVYEVGLVKRSTNKWQQLILSRVDQERGREGEGRERVQVGDIVVLNRGRNGCGGLRLVLLTANEPISSHKKRKDAPISQTHKLAV